MYGPVSNGVFYSFFLGFILKIELFIEALSGEDSSKMIKPANIHSGVQRRKGNFENRWGDGGVDRASSSDARGPGFEPWPLRCKNTTTSFPTHIW